MGPRDAYSRLPIADLMKLMRSRNPQAREDAFFVLRSRVRDHVDGLVAAFERERSAEVKRSLLELLSEAGAPSLVTTFAPQLRSTDESLRRWAVVGLRRIGSQDAREALRSAGITTG